MPSAGEEAMETPLTAGTAPATVTVNVSESASSVP